MEASQVDRTTTNNTVALAFLVVVAMGVFAYTEYRQYQREHGTANKLRAEIETLGNAVLKADRVGDKGLAMGLLDPATDLIRKLDDDPMTKIPGPRRMCLMAALRLGDGVIAVSKGDRWFSDHQYMEAIAECR